MTQDQASSMPADKYGLSPLQSGILFHSVYAADGSATPYLVQQVDLLTGQLNVRILRAAWRQVVDRNTALRSVFFWQDVDEPVQVVEHEVTVPVTELDWRRAPGGARQAMLDCLIADDCAAGFDLSKPPLLRVCLIRIGADRWWQLTTNHHLILDGWSSLIIEAEVAACYTAMVNGTSELLEVPRPYRLYIEYIASRERIWSEQFWRDDLRGFVGYSQPLRTTHAGQQAGASLILSLAADESRILRQAARRARVTLSVLIEGALALLLARRAGSDDVAFGLTVSGRSADLPGIDEMVGLFINTLPMRVRLPHDARVGEWLRSLQRKQGEMLKHEHCSLTDIQGWSEVSRGSRLFDAILVFQVSDRASMPAMPGVSRTQLKTVEWADYPLLISCNAGTEIVFDFQYDAATVALPLAERLAAEFKVALKSLSADLEAPVSGLSVLPEGDERLLVAYNDTGAVLRGGCVHEWFEERARLAPDAVAVVAGGVRLTFGEVNGRANRLARLLRGAGVALEVPVGCAWSVALTWWSRCWRC